MLTRTIIVNGIEVDQWTTDDENLTAGAKNLHRGYSQQNSQRGMTWHTSRASRKQLGKVKTGQVMVKPSPIEVRGQTELRYGYEKVGVFCYKMGGGMGKAFPKPIKHSTRKKLNQEEQARALVQEHALESWWHGKAPVRTHAWERGVLKTDAAPVVELKPPAPIVKREVQSLRLRGFAAKQEGQSTPTVVQIES